MKITAGAYSDQIWLEQNPGHASTKYGWNPTSGAVQPNMVGTYGAEQGKHYAN